MILDITTPEEYEEVIQKLAGSQADLARLLDTYKPNEKFDTTQRLIRERLKNLKKGKSGFTADHIRLLNALFEIKELKSRLDKAESKLYKLRSDDK